MKLGVHKEDSTAETEMELLKKDAGKLADLINEIIKSEKEKANTIEGLDLVFRKFYKLFDLILGMLSNSTYFQIVSALVIDFRLVSMALCWPGLIIT